MAEHNISDSDFQRRNAAILADPDIQRILKAEAGRLAATRDQGGAAREYQNGIRDLISEIAKRKGLLPDKYFVNPNNGQLEPHRGWSGMGTASRILLIGGVAAATLATAGAFGMGPMAGVFGSGGGSAAAGGGALAADGAAGIPTAFTGLPASSMITPAGAAGAAGRFGLSSILDPALRYGLPIAGGLLATRMQSNAMRDAAAMEQDYLNRALEDEREVRAYDRAWDEEGRAYDRAQTVLKRNIDTGNTAYDRAKYAENTNYDRNRYADFLQTLEPYRSAGVTATQRMQQLMGMPVNPYTGPDYNQVAQNARTPIPTNPTVTLKSPDGEVRQFAWSDPNVPVFIANGATIQT